MVLEAHLLIAAYCQGIFPMAHDDGIYWYDPDPRAIIPLDDGFYVPRRLGRKVRRGWFDVRFDYDFRGVIEACARPSVGREETWISQEFVESYTELHAMGVAHSVEAWREGRLVGGLYGVTIQGLFAGESMFSFEPDASKVALVHLVDRLRRGGFMLLDTQFQTEHLRQFGTVEISRTEYKRRLAEALKVRGVF